MRDDTNVNSIQDSNSCTTSVTLLYGESFFIYQFLLYSDGFNLQSGSAASCEGMYMLLLNYLPDIRSSMDSIRVLSVSPPGVTTSTKAESMLLDLQKERSTGFKCFDAIGNPISLLIDLVGVLGDNTALNAKE